MLKLNTILTSQKITSSFTNSQNIIILDNSRIFKKKKIIYFSLFAIQYTKNIM